MGSAGNMGHDVAYTKMLRTDEALSPSFLTSLSDFNTGTVSQATIQVTVPSKRWTVHGSCLHHQGGRSTDGKWLIIVTGLYMCLVWPAHMYVLLALANDILNVLCPATTLGGACSHLPQLKQHDIR